MNIPLDQSISSAHAILRVLVRVEEYVFCADHPLSDWYKSGYDFLQKHHARVVFGEVAK